jgi:hypothetical protein
MLPVNFPGRDDVVSDIFEAMPDRSLRREDVKARVQSYITATIGCSRRNTQSLATVL